MHVKILKKKCICENVWPANLALVIYVSTHCVETVKLSLTTINNSQLTWWCSGNTSDLGASGPGFNPRLRQGFLCLIFCFVVVVFLIFCPKTQYLSQKLAISFAMLIYLVSITYSKTYDRL